jgi:hypothetical protein
MVAHRALTTRADALAAEQVVFYAAALALTLARGFVESVPAVMPPPGGG